MQQHHSRREALKFIGAGGAFCLLPKTSTAACKSAVAGAWTLEALRKRIGTRFEFRCCDNVGQFHALKLTDLIENSWIAEKDPKRPANLRRASISLFFQSSSANLDGCYWVALDSNQFQIVFLNSIGRPSTASTYEVILN